ncbi:MAG: hypothetical protein AAGO57_07675 [Pseudomonadota bacterium]
MTIKQVLLALPCLGLGWLAVLVVVGLLSDEAPAAVVILPGDTFANDLDADFAILAANGFSLTVRSDLPDVAERLYAAGALLVLPAGLPGCLPLPKALRT